MLYEVGPWFDATDADTIAGNIGTPLLNRKCGYVDIDGDSGGCTKYGIAQADNPSVNVPALNLAGAQQVYFSSYWIPGKCDQITSGPVTIFQFDMGVNNGLGRAAKILQQAAGVTVDGNIGPATLAAVNALDPATLINSLSTIRANRYNTIVQNDPSQAKFLAGWLRRNTEVTQFSLAQLSQS
jgi:lysozyme family protein